MRVRLGAALSSAIAISVSLITLLGLLLSGDTLGLPVEFVDAVRDVTAILLEMATIVVALTILIGIGN